MMIFIPPLPIRPLSSPSASILLQKLFREDPKAYKRKVRECTARSME